MCDPLSIAGLALTGASTVANSVANSRVQGARNEALAAENVRQSGYDKEADAVNTKAQNLYTDFGDQQTAKSNELSDFFTGQDVPEPSAASALPTSASNIVVKEEQKQRGQAKAFTDRTGQALGKLRSFGEALGQNSRLQARDAGLVGQIGGFKTGSSNVLPYELDAASHKGDSLKTLGDVLGGFGTVGLSAGLRGGSLSNLFGGGSTAVTGGSTGGSTTLLKSNRYGGV